MFISLVYVSRRLTDRVVPRAQLDPLVAEWARSNAQRGVRGALLCTGRHIAHMLEGPEAVVDPLLAEIARDPRHEHVTIIERKPIDGYSFPDWCLAYWGAASYMDQKIAAVLENHDVVAKSGDTAQLYDLIRRLARERRKQDEPIGRLPLD